MEKDRNALQTFATTAFIGKCSYVPICILNYKLVIAIAKSQRARQKHEDDSTYCASTEKWCSHFTIWKKTEISQRVLYVWKPFEHKEFSCNIFFCALKRFSFISSDTQCKIKCLIKWISRCLFIESISFCYLLTQNVLLHYLMYPSRDLFSLLSQPALALMLLSRPFRVFARLPRWQLQIILKVLNITLFVQ